METRTLGQQSGRLALVAIASAVLLLRLPFIHQAIGGDDPYFLASAEHAQIEPLHPNNVRYVFEGRDVDFRGFPHPPLNAWVLAGLIAAFGAIRETPFHLFYILFSLAAAFSMYALAMRFSPHPFWATLLFLAAPAFVINGNTFEADVPFLAFWMAGIACFVRERYAFAAVLLACAALTAFQAVIATPILAAYAWMFARRSKAAWCVAAVPVVVIAGWEGFERLTTGVLPAAVAAGYQQSYGYQRLALKLRNAGALLVHFGTIVFPVVLFRGMLACVAANPQVRFLASWVALFFLGALAFFYAGSARYLLPLAAPLILLVSRLSVRWLAAGFILQMPLSLALATVNYQHWNAYRDFASRLATEAATRRIWVNGEWGLRYYLESEGALPIHRDQWIPAGDIVVTSELAYPVAFSHAWRALVTVAGREIVPAVPLRLIGLTARSGYSTVDKGFLPFDISRGPVDRVRAELLEDRQPSRTDLPMNAPEAAEQIVSGIYDLEAGQWRWMGRRGVLVLKTPPEAEPLHVAFFIPDLSPARRVAIALNGRAVAQRVYEKPGGYEIVTAPVSPPAPAVWISIEVDGTFTPPGDNRQLGMVLTEAGFRK